MSGDGEYVTVGRKHKGGYFSAAWREIESFLFNFFPIAEADNFDFVLACEGKFIEGIVDCHCFERSGKDSFAFNLVSHFLFVGTDVTVVSFREADHDVAISIVLIIDYSAVLGFKHQFKRSRPIGSDVVD